MDRWREGWMERMKKIPFTTLTLSLSLSPSLPLSLSLIAALISHAPALNGDAGERNTAAANSYHDFCSN